MKTIEELKQWEKFFLQRVRLGTRFYGVQVFKACHRSLARVRRQLARREREAR
jgi:hypothetical protein